MATGQLQGGGLFASPDMPSLGPATWAQMGGVHPDSPLVGGRGAPTGGVDPDYKYRRVAISAPDASAGVASGAPMAANWRELFNFKGNPVGWVLIASLIYLGLTHVTLQGRAHVGKAKASAALGA